MGSRRNNAVLGFLQGWQAGTKIGNSIKGALISSDLADAAQSNQVTESASPDEAAAAVPQIQAARDAEIQRQVDSGADPIESAAKVGQQYAPAIQEADRKAGLTSAEYSVADRTFNRKSDADIAARGLNLGAIADVYAKHGEPEKAAKALVSGLSITKAMRDQADDDELRQSMANQDVGRGQPSGMGGKGANPTRFDFDTYMKTMAPKGLETLVKQGRLQEAKLFRDFVDTEEGRNYAELWATGVHRHALGDSVGALQQFEKLYNLQAYNDQKTVKLVPLDDGKQYRIDQFDLSGNHLGSKTGATSELASQAASALSPMSLVKFRVEQQASRAKEAGTLDRQIQLEELRQQGQEYREDRRDERLAKRLASQGGGRVTLTQEAHNAEIDAAREAVAGLSTEDIRKRTAPTTATGRENPDFDPSLARAAKLAGRRKVGADDWFDQRQGGGQGQQPAGIDRNDISTRFRADRAMDSYRLGKDTPNGVEVLDKSGKIIGHYR